MKRKVLFMLALLCAVAQGAWARVIDGLPGWDPTMENGNTYRVIRDWEYDWGRINVQGDVKLVVEEGYTVNFQEGIELSEGNTLTIEGEGTININIRRDYQSGIGAKRMGTLIINGCTLNVKGGLFAAAIGGDMENTGGGRVVINGGVVNATGNRGASAIGGGYRGVCGEIVINGGQVTADCGDRGGGFGGGNDAHVTGTLTLGWTNPDDFVRTIGIHNFMCYKVRSISFANGKQFVIEGTQTIANSGNIPDKKIVPYVAIAPLPGYGTADTPYTIRTADEWDRFAESVAFGNSYRGQYVKLAADISATRKCGYVSGAKPSRAFCGTFDGGGKTLTAAIIDEKNQGTALFCNINGATIRNLTVAGTINAKRSYTAGLVGFANGTNLIENCTVNATIGIESDYAAGFVGNGMESTTTLKNCVFAGIINGTNGRRSHVGGIYGWTTAGTPTLQNCLEKGSYNNIASMHPMGLQNDRGSISQCYYLNAPFGNPANSCVVSGAYQVGTEPVEGELSMQQLLADGHTYFVPCIVSNVDPFYELTYNNVSIEPTVTRTDGTKLTLGKGYLATLDDHDVRALPITVRTTGKHTLVITGLRDCTGTKTITFTVVEMILGDGSERYPYLISTANLWSLFAALVNNGDDFSGKFVKLIEDITVTDMVGTSPDKAFKGTFLGNGKTLTVNIGSASQPFGEDNCAPFRFVNGATIKDLKVAGDIYTFKKFAGGLVGRSYGTTTLTDCHVSTLIHSSIRGDGTHGGLVAMPAGPLTITGCIYDGRLLTSNGTDRCAGFVGWHNSQTISITNSLYAPSATALSGSSAETPITNGATFVRGASAGSNCYYTEPLGEAQGRQAFITLPEGNLYTQTQAADGKTYYLACSVSGIETSYTMEGGSTSITPNVTALDAALDLGMDYTATLNGNAVTAFPITITESGSYTLTLTGNSAQCTGAKRFTFVVMAPLAGTGTQEDPYLIGNVADWEKLACDVAEGRDYNGKFVKLAADISVTTMVGTSRDKSFHGTFDGDNHTLTFTCGTPESPYAEENCAPFRHVDGATIKNLKVAGDIYTSRKFAGGLVSRSHGTTTLTDCHVSTLIHSSINGDGTHAGLVAMPAGPLTIKDCIFDGRLLTTNGTTRCGGFVGWHNGQNISVTSSLYAPSATAETPITDGATFVRGARPGSYCFYTEPMGELQGLQVFATLPAGELCMQAKAADGKMYYLPCSVSGIKPSYALEGGVSITPTVTSLDNAALTLGTDYFAALDGNVVDQYPITITTDGDYALTFTGKSDNYTGTKSITVFITPGLVGGGTAEKPYLIHSVKEWNLLVANVADGRSYSGQFVKLMDDIDITLPVGVREDKPFSGTFLGNGHTLTAGISNNNPEVQGTAPFRYIKNATIKDLTIAGTIASNSNHTAGLVGFAEGTNLLENCTVSAALNIGSNYAGGIVGHGLTSSTTLRGCVFAGAVNGIGGDFANVGGLWGWCDGGAPVLENCLENGTYTAISSMHPMGLQRGWGTITSCYYVNAQRGNPTNACTVKGASQVAATDTGGEVYKSMTLVDGNSYYTPCTVRNMITLYQATGSEIRVEPPILTAADGTVLTPGTDFTYSPETVREKGNYTLTVTGRGNYSGTKTIPFSVTDNMFITPELSFLSAGEYMVSENVTVNERITISGDVVLNLGKDTKLTAPKGIELSKGNSLTINGPGTLSIQGVDDDNAGIGAVEVGTLVINGGTINVFGGKYGAGLGGSRNNVSGGSITINGGLLNILGGDYINAAPIGGGYDDKPGQYGVCGDIVINGGHVTPLSLALSSFGPGKQVNDQIYNSGTVTLGWTNPDDCIFMGMTQSAEKAHLNSLTFAEGKQFLVKNTTKIADPTSLAIENIVPLLALANTGDNSSQLDDYDGMKLPVLLQGRTLYKDGKWNTLCLPFNVALKGSPLEGAVARPLNEASISGTTLNLTFGEAVTTLEAGTPYIIKWAKADDYADDDAHNILNPLFAAANIDKTDRSYDNAAAGDAQVRFLGTYQSMTFNATDRSILLMGSGNTLYYPTTGADLGAQRAYIKIGADGGQPAQVKAFNIDFGDGDTATGVISLTPDPSPVGEGSAGAWYDMQGRRLDGKPSRAGIYVNNGRKVVIK